MTIEDQLKTKIALLKSNNLHAQAATLEKQLLEIALNSQTPTGFPVISKSDPQTGEEWLAKFLTTDPEMELLKKHTVKLAALEVGDPVLIQGESGTGKELIARALHGIRPGRFVALNCAGLPENLVESELFGHIKGSFTSSVGDKVGLFEEAANGTIFLDEIGELALPLQAKLLRVVQFRKIRRVGDIQDRSINCRIVCATHRNLPEMIKEKRFRLDLYGRISTFRLETKPLRHRPQDVTLIVGALLVNEPPELVKELASNIRTLMGSEQDLNAQLNVRFVEQMVRRYKVFGNIRGI